MSWSTGNNTFAIRVFSDYESLDTSREIIKIKEPENESSSVTDFSEAEGTNIDIDISSNNSSIKLKLPDKNISFVVDKSGSMKWNDKNDYRLDNLQRLVRRISSAYPGDVDYNFYTFGGEKVKIDLMASLYKENPFSQEVLSERFLNNDPFIDEQNEFAGVRIVRKVGSYPTSALDGKKIYEGTGSFFLDSSLENNKDYYYKLFTFNEDYTKWSSGTNINIKKSNNHPIGLGHFDYKTFNGTGIKLDENIIGLWHFNEDNTNYIYDFSKNLDLEIVGTNIIRLNENEVPIGVSGLRFNGSNTYLDGDDYSDRLKSSNLTIMSWVYLYNYSSQGVIVSREDTSNTNLDYKFYVDTSTGELTFEDSTGIYNSTLSVVELNKWVHVAVTRDCDNNLLKFYLDGVLVESISYSSTPTLINNGNFTIGYSPISGDYFFGLMTEVSVHNIVRDSSYIMQSSFPRQIRNNDNGDRLLVVYFNINDTNDCENGKFYLIKNKYENTLFIEDGTVILEDDIREGYYYCTDNDIDFSTSYFYRLFSKNTEGIFNHYSNCPFVEINLSKPEDEVLETLDEYTINNPQNCLLKSANKVNYITWSTSSLVNEKSIKIFASENEYPFIDAETSNFTGELVFFGDASSGKFWHKNLFNNNKYYYTLVFVDKYGRYSRSTNLVGVPENVINEEIPLKNVDNLYYEYKKEGVVLHWENPSKNLNISAYFDEDLIVFAKLSNENGELITSTNFKISANVTPQIFYDEGVDFDVFEGETGLTTFENDSEIYNLAIDPLNNGIIKSFFNLKRIENLKNIKYIDFNISFNIYKEDADGNIQSEYTSESILIRYKNPFELQLLNRNSTEIKVKNNFKSDILNNQDILSYQMYNGMYTNSSSNFVIRCLFDYKENYLKTGCSISTVAYRVSKDLSNINSSYSLIEEAEEIEIIRNTSVSITEVDDLDLQGNPNGSKKKIAYLDIELTTPETPQNILVFVKAAKQDFIFVKSMLVVYKNPIEIELNVKPPVLDGIDVAKQTAMVYIVDPIYPDDKDLRTYPPDGTIVKWEVNNNGMKPRAFYSLDGVPVSDGVYSYTINGVATAYFGPVSDTEYEIDNSELVIDEVYQIKAEVLYNNVLSSTESSFRLSPLFNRKEEGANSYLLIEFDKPKQILYSDGVNYSRAIISHDPSTSTTNFSDCFREAVLSKNKNIFSLKRGSTVVIETNNENVEIIWGNVREEYDPYLGHMYLNTDRASKSLGKAYVRLSDNDYTYIYFRYNSEVGQKPIGSEYCGQKCGCLDNLLLNKFEKEIVVFAHTTTIVDTKVVNLIGGGSIENGIPPTILLPTDPLSITLVGRKNNNNLIDGLKIDGVTENRLVFEVSYAGNPVPDGTVVSFSTLNFYDTLLNVKENSSETVQTIDSDINQNITKSYAYVNLFPIQNNRNFESYLIASTSYSYRKSSTKNAKTCLSLAYSPSDNVGSNISSLFSSRTSTYDLVTTTWTDRSSMNFSRSLHTSQIHNDKMYVIGGINSSGFLDVVEEYDLATDTWTIKSSMNNPRAGLMSAIYNGKIYVIGGFYYDDALKEIKVSRKIEVYDIALDSWTELRDMPVFNDGNINEISYGVALGYAKYVSSGSNKIYVLSGIRDVLQYNTIPVYNDRVLTYNIDDSMWSYSDPISEEEFLEYFRISPNGFNKSTYLYVLNGIYQSQDNTKNHLSSCYRYDMQNGTLERCDYLFSDLPIKSYKVSQSENSNNLYLLGGSNENSEYSNKLFKIDYSGANFSLTSLDDIEYSVNSSSSVIGTVGGNSSIVLVGGNNSGRSEGFVKIDLEVVKPEILLNDYNNITLKVILKDENGDILSQDLDVKFDGYVQSIDSDYFYLIEDKYVKYKVDFEKDLIKTKNGIGYVTLSSRSDDPLKEITLNNKIVEGEILPRYSLVVSATVLDNYYHGNTIVNTVSAIRDFNTSNCYSIMANNLIYKLQNNNLDYFNILSFNLSQNFSKKIDAYSNTIWLPKITKINTEPLGYTDAILAINEISEKESVGVSPLFDAINELTNYLGEEASLDKEKLIFVMTDNEENSSSTNISSLIKNINSVDLGDFSPVINLVYNINERGSNYINNSNVLYLNRIADLTKGQSLTIVEENMEDDLILRIVSQLNGSVGFGSAIWIYDFEEVVSINSIEVFFDLYENTNGNWSISFSEDGHEYSNSSVKFKPNYEATFDGEKARYVKFEFKLISGLSTSNEDPYDLTATANVPCINQVRFTYTQRKDDFIFLNRVSTNDGEEGSNYNDEILPQQVLISSDDSTNYKDSKTVFGVSTSNSIHLEDYYFDSQPLTSDISGNERVVIPIRNGVRDGENIEPLVKIDNFIYKALNGNWNTDATVVVLDSDGNEIESSEYRVAPRKGYVIFTKRIDKNLFINISNSSQIRIVAKVDNYDSNSRVEIKGIGYYYK